jgi:hypothetical protein
VLSLVLFGCGGPETHTVTGRITLDGSPLRDALVAFVPASEEGTWACGRTDSDGRYKLEQGADVEGTTAGRYTVRITTLREGNAEADPPIPFLPETVPTKYNLQSELTAVVTPQDTAFDFNLGAQDDAVVTADAAHFAELSELASAPKQAALPIHPNSRTGWYVTTVSVWLLVLVGCFVWWRFNERRMLGPS